MAQASMSSVQEARSIFGRFGYSVSRSGPDMLAEREWRTVHVTVLSLREATECRSMLAGDGTETPYRFRYFVAWDDHISALRERLCSTNPPYKWAIIGMSDGGRSDYEIVRDTNTQSKWSSFA